MLALLLSVFSKKETTSETNPNCNFRVVYPFEGYENLSLGERYKVIGQGMIENKIIIKK
jgi:hypothetical protein